MHHEDLKLVFVVFLTYLNFLSVVSHSLQPEYKIFGQNIPFVGVIIFLVPLRFARLSGFSTCSHFGFVLSVVQSLNHI